MNDRLAVYMVDVGQDDSSIVLLPDGRVVIFDCADDHVLRKILGGWKTPEIAAFVLSHLDQDHIAGVKPYLDGRVEVLHSLGGEHERIVDDWQRPLCRPPDP